MIKKLVLATHNKGKLTELRAMLAPHGLEVIGAGELNLPEPIEDSGTFIGNASIKALAAARATSLPALADDSGLSIPALGGWPGVDTANWTKRGLDGLTEINSRLGGDRRAEAVCVLVLAQPDGSTEVFEGLTSGTLIWPPRGENGFGYDPVFLPDGETRTYAELSKEGKAALSHRGKAFRAFLARLPELCHAPV